MSDSKSLAEALQIEQTSEDTYLSTKLWKPSGARGVFGGHVIALALVASGKTVDKGMGLHSQHCYFILPADPTVRIEFKVDRLRDGKSYATRMIRATQGGKAIFVLAASYARPPKGDVNGDLPFGFIPSKQGLNTTVSNSLRFALEPEEKKNDHVEVGGEGQIARKRGSTHTTGFTPNWYMPFPSDVTSYEECVEEEERWRQFLDENKASLEDKGQSYLREYIQACPPERKESPVSIALAKNRPDQPRNIRMLWLRTKLQPGENPSHEDIKAMIGYITDFQFIGTAARAIGLTSASNPRLGMLATLDHTTHFYPFPADLDIRRPLLHVMEAVITDVASGRGMVRGLVYTEKGVLIAVTSQEGVVRVDKERSAKAKL